jgi:hypothetical protein
MLLTLNFHYIKYIRDIYTYMRPKNIVLGLLIFPLFL